MSELNEQQKGHLKSTWAVFWSPENRTTFGASAFAKLFQAHPEYQQLFRNMRHIDNYEEMAKSPELKAHGIKVGELFNQMMDNLDTPDIFKEHLQTMAKIHSAHRDKLTKKHFEHMEPALISTMEEYIGDKLTPKAKEAWIAAYRSIIDSMFAEF